MADEEIKGMVHSCPNCQEMIKPANGFRIWCSACNWNLGIEDQDSEKNPLLRWNQRLNQIYGKMLLDRMCAMQPSSLPVNNDGAGGLIAFVIGTYTAMILSTLGVGTYVIWAGWPSPLPLIFGAALLFLPWLVRPRWAKVPSNALRRSQFPHLFKLLSKIADGLGAPRADYVIIDEQMNASVYRAGSRQEIVLTLGLPLWVLLSTRERVALLAHEFAHLVNGDPTRGRWLFAANSMLDAWIDMFNLPASDTYGMIAKALVWPMSVPFRCLRYLLFKASFVDSQTAEYRADYLAALAAGTSSVSDLLKSFKYHRAFSSFLQTTSGAVNAVGIPIILQFKRNIEKLPSSENTRLERLELTGDASIDASHPPTRFRLTYLAAHAMSNPAIICSQQEIEKVDNELLSLMISVSEALYVSAFGES
jgi:Zn-dependent protease with chaperone function